MFDGVSQLYQIPLVVCPTLFFLFKTSKSVLKIALRSVDLPEL